MSEPIKPALSPEGWAVFINYAPKGQHGVTGGAQNCGALGQTRYELAAMALYGQPFGFTREDVVLLHNSIPSLGKHEELGNLADRIEALLPPEAA